MGPLVGRLLTPAEPEPDALLDELRVELLTTLFAAAGRARTAARQEGTAAARAQLGHAVWLDAYRHAAERAASQSADLIDRRIRDAARVSRMPDRRLVRHLLTSADRETLLHRMISAGIPLERTSPPEEAEPWADGLRRSAAALETSWERLVRFVGEERVRGDAVARAVSQWRRSPVPLWILTGALLVLALYLGLVVGGYLPAPGPLANLRALWWSLPWP
ncbi:MAG TPA: hypothetical protein VGA42_01075 [Gemmatimonadales bacterium]